VTDMQVESGSAVREAVGQAVEKGKETAQQGMEKAKEAAGEARGMFTEQLDQRSTLAGERASALAQAARRVAGELRGEGQDDTAKLAEATADRVERLAGYLRDSEGEMFLSDLENFARRRPLLAAAVGFVAGLAASRVVKASAERRAHSGNGKVTASETDGGHSPVSVPGQSFGHAEAARL
jgi:hypothetical protein